MQSFPECYSASKPISGAISLFANASAALFREDSTAARWAPRSDSIVLRWRDSLAVFPARVDVGVGRVGLAGEAFTPLTVRPGCPDR